MFGNEFLSTYPAKLLEYALGIGYLLLFIPFWRYVQGRSRPAPVAEKARRRPAGATAPAGAGWFTVPEQVFLHPGHTWARVEPDGRVTVGIDEFAHKLVGPVARVEVPEAGEPVVQGEPAIRLAVGDRTVSLLSPVEGVVVAVNPKAARNQASISDPYGDGWLFQVRPPRLAANVKQLLSGATARRWVEQAGESLAARLSPELGLVLQDGGAPVNGIAQELDPEKWDELARTYFLT
jgi:glycine cleavage system H protein